MTRWREITFYVDKPDSAGTDPDSAGAGPKSAGTGPDSEGTDPDCSWSRLLSK